MKATFAILAAAVALLSGCATVVRTTGLAPYPESGTYLQYARDGRLMQKSVWQDRKLRSAWAFDLEGRWSRIATTGNGQLLYIDEDGRMFGFAEYFRGAYVRGAH